MTDQPTEPLRVIAISERADYDLIELSDGREVRRERCTGALLGSLGAHPEGGVAWTRLGATEAAPIQQAVDHYLESHIEITISFGLTDADLDGMHERDQRPESATLSRAEYDRRLLLGEVDRLRGEATEQAAPAAPQPFDAATARRHALALRNSDGMFVGEGPYLEWCWESETGEGVLTGFTTEAEIKTGGDPGSEGPWVYPSGINVCVADACTMAHVPPFDGQQMPETAEAIAQIGGEMLAALAEIERIKDAADDQWCDTLAALRHEVELLTKDRDHWRDHCKAVDALCDAVGIPSQREGSRIFTEHRVEMLIAERDVLRSRLATGLRCCLHCGNPATCFGRYEGHGDVAFGCDTCCGHGNEDGWCKPIDEAPADPAMELLAAKCEQLRERLASRREWRKGIPTPEQLEHHEQHGGWWLVREESWQRPHTYHLSYMVPHDAGQTQPPLPVGPSSEALGAVPCSNSNLWAYPISGIVGMPAASYAPIDRDAMPVPWLAEEVPS